MFGLVLDFELSNKPKYIQLYEAIKSEIESGRLSKNEKLPSVRQLIGLLGVSKATVENAYQQLMVEGYIESRNKSGYYVGDFEFGLMTQKAYSPNPNPLKASRPKRFNTDDAEESAFQFGEWKKAVNRVLEYETKTLLSYGEVQGESALRHEIAQFVHQSRGVKCTPDQIVIGAGIQYLFSMIAICFRNTTQKMAFEYPGFTKGMFVFEDLGYEMARIPVEKDGINVTALEDSGAKMVYVSPSHQYPTGSIMTIKKRLQLLEWARKNDGLIIEDDYDSLLRYEGYPVPALQGLGEGAHVIYMGSFSKLLMPALRISFMILPKQLMERFAVLLPRYSQSVSKIDQLALAHYMAEGAFERHIRRIKKIYGRKNQLLVEAFKTIPHPGIALVGSSSGLHVTLSFDARIDLKGVTYECAELGIVLESVAGEQLGRYVVFSYSGIPDHEMEMVVEKLVRVTQRHWHP